MFIHDNRIKINKFGSIDLCTHATRLIDKLKLILIKNDYTHIKMVHL